MVYLLVPACDDPSLNESEYSVGEHLGVYSKILMIAQLSGECVRQTPYTHLQASSVGDELSAFFSDKYVSLSWFRIFLREKGSIVTDKVVEGVQGDQVTISERYVRVDNGDFNPCRLYSGRGAVNRGPK